MRLSGPFFAFALTLASGGSAVHAGQFQSGADLYKQHCAQCHGADGRGGAGYDYPLWGTETQIAKFQTAKGLFEYLQYLMPFDDPSKVSDAQKWDIVQYMLAQHGSLPRDHEIDPASAAGVAIK